MLWRRLERVRDGVTERFDIGREGIRCFERWSSTARRGGATTVILSNEAHARRHEGAKIRQRLRKGFVELEPYTEPDGDPDALIVPTILAHLTKDWFTPADYLPVDGVDDVVCQASPARFEYLVLRDGGRGAVLFGVGERFHDPAAATAFARFVAQRRDLAFDGTSHHKVTLPEPVGPFSHALFCSPALARPMAAIPALRPKVAVAFPIHDCEIGVDDSEAVVEVRISGHGSIPRLDWTRPPRPVIDLRWEGVPTVGDEREFKVYDRRRLDRLLGLLRGAGPGAWAAVRSFRGEVWCLRAGDVDAATPEALDRFLVGGHAP